MPLNDTDVDILIGYDNAYLMKSSAYLQHHNDLQNYPTAVETPLGWYVFGPKTNASTDQLTHVHRVYIDDNPRHFYSLYESDVCGVEPRGAVEGRLGRLGLPTYFGRVGSNRPFVSYA